MNANIDGCSDARESVVQFLAEVKPSDGPMQWHSLASVLRSPEQPTTKTSGIILFPSTCMLYGP